jgi:hypothetical protein
MNKKHWELQILVYERMSERATRWGAGAFVKQEIYQRLAGHFCYITLNTK